uniref:Uncharacterized protein n=1 Tax=Helianthus annuus TaxID=4232 RepID=A0A251VH33_HELAN
MFFIFVLYIVIWGLNLMMKVRVTKEEDMKRVLFDLYGGKKLTLGSILLHLIIQRIQMHVCLCIRESEKAKILCKVDGTDMAEHLRIRLKKEEAHLYTNIKDA